MTKPTIAQVALPVPLRQVFDYRLPADLADAARVGSRVRVPFGPRKQVGVITRLSHHSDYDHHKLKPIDQLLDLEPVLSGSLLDLALWASQYYQHPIGETLLNCLPVKLRNGDPSELPGQKRWRATRKGALTNPEKLGRAVKQQAALAALQQHPNGLSSQALAALGVSRQILKALADKSLAEEVEWQPEKPGATSLLTESPLTLSEEQARALETITASEHFHVTLLDGITGSGKTEVYLQAIEQVLKAGKQALVLVPEIGLTPQTYHRFEKRFGVPVRALHSQLTDNERLATWIAARNGEARIIIGTRSAVFTPLKNPGLLIIDEEHDLSFKQADSLRYSARDVLIMRGKLENIPVVLGSATPSLETLYNASQGRYQLARLTRRAGTAAKPAFELIDLRRQDLFNGLAQPVIQQMTATLKAGQQVLVFINRRGYAPALLCHDCGWIADCPACQVHFTYHKSRHRLHCHHCDREQRPPTQCPECQGSQLVPVGLGTEKLEESLSQRFRKLPVIRIDRDTTSRKAAMQKLLKPVLDGEPAILVGTQMLAKGHHFPRVTLVVILDCDSGLFSTDFRALERTGQLMTQVAGRSGRGEQAGRVLIQTHQPDHPLLQTLITEGYHAFARQLTEERRQLQFPPFGYLVLLRAESPQPEQALEFLQQARHRLEQAQISHTRAMLLGPAPAPMERRAGRYRAQLMLQSPQRSALHQLLNAVLPQLEKDPLAARVRWSVDVDPQEMF